MFTIYGKDRCDHISMTLYLQFAVRIQEMSLKMLYATIQPFCLASIMFRNVDASSIFSSWRNDNANYAHFNRTVTTNQKGDSSEIFPDYETPLSFCFRDNNVPRPITIPKSSSPGLLGHKIGCYMPEPTLLLQDWLTAWSYRKVWTRHLYDPVCWFAD